MTRGRARLSRVRQGLALSGLCAVALVAAWTSGKLADRLGSRLGLELDRSLGGAWRAAQVQPERDPVLAAPAYAMTPNTVAAPEPEVEAPVAARRPPRAKRAKPEAAPQRGVRVSAATVLRLARSGARPEGSLVPPSDGCPAGLRLSGVGALGIGLRDGDVLTHADGRPATSRGGVIGSVIAARGAHQREIGGRFCRAGQSYNLIVDQPYLD